MGIHAAALQGGKHGIAAQQGNLALRGIPAQQNGHLAEIRRRLRAAYGALGRQQTHAASPTIRTSAFK